MILLFLTLFWGIFSSAGVETTSTLPVGVYSPEFSFGILTNLDQKFNSQGQIVGVADQYHLNLAGQNIAKIYKPAGLLISTLNKVTPSSGTTQALGDSLSLGTIDFQAKPSIDYFIITPAFGVTKKLSLGFGFPIIHFHNEMSILAGGQSNVSEIKSLMGSSSTEIENALTFAEGYTQNPTAAVQSVLTSKGYKPMGIVDFTTIGDTQIYARYRYYESPRWRLAVRPYFLLPTGRGDDPDDLGDFETGGHVGVGSYLTQELYASSRWIFSLVLQYEAYFTDYVEKRVPYDSNDLLPGLDQKETVTRSAGNLFDSLIGARYFLFHWLTLGSFYEVAFKDPDRYSGGRNLSYSLLSQDTGYTIQKVGGYLSFSTTQSYVNGEFNLPFIFDYTFSNVFAGINTAQAISHIFNLRMFF